MLSALPGRLANNLRVHKQILEGIRLGPHEAAPGVVVPGMLIPFDGRKLYDWIAYIAEGLLWHHWKVILSPEHMVHVASLTSTGQNAASYERKRLIEQKVPFIVPGNQLYLPDPGIDLREYFRRPQKEAVDAFSPATQALLLRALLSESTQTQWNPAAMAHQVGYTAMTVSRVGAHPGLLMRTHSWPA